MRHGIFDLGTPPTLDHGRYAIDAIRAGVFPWEKLVPYHRWLGGITIRFDPAIAPNSGLTMPSQAVQINPDHGASVSTWVLPHELGHRVDQVLWNGGGTDRIEAILHKQFDPDGAWHWTGAGYPTSSLAEHVASYSWAGEDYNMRLMESFAQSFGMAFFPTLLNGPQWYGHALPYNPSPWDAEFRAEVLAAANKIRLFPNLAGHPHEPGVEWAIGQGILDWPGFDESFQTGLAVTRGYMAAMVNRFYDTRISPPEANPLAVWVTDIGGHPYESSVRWACGMGIVSGYPDGTFRPNLQINREQAATYIRRTCDKIRPIPANRTAPTFTDISANDPHLPNVVWCAERGILLGKSSTTFDPLGGMTREAMSTTLMRAAALL